ncbi:MAG: hypothetical protein SOH48_07820 [Eubacteriales bacterium]|jgi:hypothetical protein
MRDVLAQMTRRQKIRYIFDYYKVQIALILAAVLLVGYGSFRLITRPNVLVSVGLLNTTLSTPSKSVLTDGYLDTLSERGSRDQVKLTGPLFISGDPGSDAYEYAYASSLKLQAEITDRSLDVVLLDEKSLAVLEDNEYLMKLPSSIQKSSDPYAVSLDGTSFSQQAGMDGTVYAGIIANTKNEEQAVRYVRYLLS